MFVKVTAFITTLVLNIAIGVAVFFFLLLAMNGYSESDANYGLVTYVLLALLVSLTMSAGALMLVRRLIHRGYRSFVALVISVPLFSLAGAGLKIVCSIVGVLVAEYVRVN